MHAPYLLTQPRGFISAADASARFCITNDHVTRLCRQKKISGIFLGRVWFVDVRSLEAHLRDAKQKRQAQHQALSEQLRADYARHRSLLTS